jgi:AraC-like DNA-binding protein
MYYIDPTFDFIPVVNRSANDDFPEHFHDNIELLFINSGERKVVIDGVDFSEPEGSLTVIFPFQLHGFSGDGDGVCSCLAVNPQQIPGYSEEALKKIPSHPVLGEAELGKNIELVKFLMNCGLETSKLTMNSLATALLSEISDVLGLVERTNCSIGPHVLPVIVSHCPESDFSLDRLSKLTGIGNRALSVFFSDIFGMTFSKFVRKCRLNNAVSLLRSGRDMSITEITFEVGFSSVRTFNRCFFDEFGVSPSKFSANGR